MKKVFALLLVVTLMATLFVGIGSAEEEFNWRAYEGTKIQVMFNQHNYQKAITDYGKLEEFQELTGIEVEYSVTPEENMTGAYQVWDYASAGYMEPLDEYITDPEYNFADFYPGVAGTLAWDCVPGHAVGSGHQWALPMGYELNDIAYNKKYFDENNIAVPKTTGELLELSKSLKGWHGGENDYGIAVRGTRNWATIHPGYMSLFASWSASWTALRRSR